MNDARIATCLALPQSSKIFVIRAFFFEKWLLTHILAGSEVRNLPASKLASDFDFGTLVSLYYKYFKEKDKGLEHCETG